MFIEKFTSPKVLDMPLQVQKNTCDIKELKNYLKPYYKCVQTLSEDADSVPLSATNIPEDAEVNGFVLDRSGKLFNIFAINSGTAYIEFWATLTIGV